MKNFNSFDEFFILFNRDILELKKLSSNAPKSIKVRFNKVKKTNNQKK